MRPFRPILLLMLMLAPSCGKDPVPAGADPALRVTLLEASAWQARVEFTCIDADRIAWGGSSSGSPELRDTLKTGTTANTRLEMTINGLVPGSGYIFAARAVGPAGEESPLQELRFTTASGPQDIYPWESARTGIPVPADMTLIPGPSSHRTPLEWDKERWSSHVSYKDEKGTEHWLFDSFLLIEGQQTGVYGSPGHTYVLTEAATPSAPKELWQQLLDFWFDGGTFLQQESYWGDGSSTFGRWYTGRMVAPTPVFPDGQLSALDACIRETAARIGAPPHKRYVIMAIPEPIYFENYITSVRNPAAGNTTYWGKLDGSTLDFSRLEDRIAACRWFIDETRAAFDRKGYEYIELLGFYILPEVLSTTWRAEFKQYDKLWPAIASYLHACNEGLYWIPYHLAEGYKTWESFGIDIAYMQPNWYWHTASDAASLDLSNTFAEINKYRMGLELEFEYSMVEAVGGPQSAAMYRSRFQEYLDWARSSGVYGNRSIALYSGTDAMHQLATSTLPDDVAMYHKLCHFIIESPLKK